MVRSQWAPVELNSIDILSSRPPEFTRKIQSMALDKSQGKRTAVSDEVVPVYQPAPESLV